MEPSLTHNLPLITIFIRSRIQDLKLRSLPNPIELFSTVKPNPFILGIVWRQFTHLTRQQM